MSPPVPVLSVEERLRIVRASLDALAAVAHLFEEPTRAPIPPAPPHRRTAPRGPARPSADPAFVTWTGLMAAALTEQLQAIRAALPDDCVDRDAPLPTGGR